MAPARRLGTSRRPVPASLREPLPRGFGHFQRLYAVAVNQKYGESRSGIRLARQIELALVISWLTSLVVFSEPTPQAWKVLLLLINDSEVMLAPSCASPSVPAPQESVSVSA